MYSFSPRGEESISLRPEFTAAICRAFISNGLEQHLPLKLFSYGPVFRYERPQHCRQRQFHQLNFEVLGNSNFMQDVEMVIMSWHLLSSLGVIDKVQLNINSLGCAKTRLSYRTALVEYLSKYIDDLSDDSKQRLQKNPLRILDSKNSRDQEILLDAPRLRDHFSKEASEYFDNILRLLDDRGIKYIVNDKLVRGLDYYTHSIFEYITTELGAQGTVLAGGRYDNLIKNLGGKDVQGIGFAAGIERIMALTESKPEDRRALVVVPISDAEYLHAFTLTNLLRECGFKIHFDLDKEMNVKKRMQKANKINAKAALFVGAEEVEKNEVKVKDLDSASEIIVSNSDLIDKLTMLRNFYEL
jgi:histidyl-tRNA synthetase